MTERQYFQQAFGEKVSIRGSVIQIGWKLKPTKIFGQWSRHSCIYNPVDHNSQWKNQHETEPCADTVD